MNGDENKEAFLAFLDPKMPYNNWHWRLRIFPLSFFFVLTWRSTMTTTLLSILPGAMWASCVCICVPKFKYISFPFYEAWDMFLHTNTHDFTSLFLFSVFRIVVQNSRHKLSCIVGLNAKKSAKCGASSMLVPKAAELRARQRPSERANRMSVTEKEASGLWMIEWCGMFCIPSRACVCKDVYTKHWSEQIDCVVLCIFSFIPVHTCTHNE